MTDSFDVLIIGGGLAGISTALSLVRSLHTAVVFDSQNYRNRKANWLHTLPGWDGRDPAEYRAAARQNILSKYNTVQFAMGVEIENVSRDPEAEFPFVATDTKGRVWRGRKLALTMGIQDIPLDVEGYTDCFANGIFHCLVHRGYEERGCASAGVVAAGGDDNLHAAKHLALQCRRYTSGPVTVYTHGNEALAAECQEVLGPMGFRIESRRIVRFIKEPVQSQLSLEFENGGDKITEGFIIHRGLPLNNGAFAEQLGVETNKYGFYKTNPPFFETSVPGIFAAGDCGDPFKIGTYAVSMGAFIAGGLQMQLDAEMNRLRAAGPAYQIVK